LVLGIVSSIEWIIGFKEGIEFRGGELELVRIVVFSEDDVELIV
tara:strand:+ start:3203 stop:3334 length:132 start_codon:yes stop_codon:yes gene_type:complete